MKSKVWYLLGIILILIGLIPGGLSIAWGIQGITDDKSGFKRAVIPGTNELQLDKKGEYTVYHEYESQMNGEVIHSSCKDLSTFNITIHPKNQPEQPVEFQSLSGTSTYEFGSRKGRSMFWFQVEKPGTYVVDAQRKNDSEKNCGRTVLAIGKDVVLGFILDIFKIVGGGCFGLLFLAGGFVVILIAFLTGESDQQDQENRG